MEHLLCDMILSPLDEMSHIQDFIKSHNCSVSGLYHTLYLYNFQQLRFIVWIYNDSEILHTL